MPPDGSLRPIIAQILRTVPAPLSDPFVSYRRAQGADLLDWVEAREASPIGDEIAELNRLRDFADGVRDAFTHIQFKGGASGRLAHIAGLLQDASP